MNRSRIGDLSLLCLLSGSRWLFEHFFPSSASLAFSGLVHFLVIGATAAAFVLMQGRTKAALPKTGYIALPGAIVFALPVMVLQVSERSVPEFTRVVLFCSIPLMTVLFLLASDRAGAYGVSSGSLSTSVLGLGGSLLLFPAQLPGDARGWICLALLIACCGLVAYGGIVLFEAVESLPTAMAVMRVSFGCAVFFGVCFVMGRPDPVIWRSVGTESVRGIFSDLPIVWLSVWLIREMRPGRISARFLVVPLVTAIEGYAAMSGGVGLQAAVGMVLMLVCGAMLAVGEVPDESTEGSCLRLR